MFQKRKFTAWMLLASLIVMCSFVSFFAASAAPTYADGGQHYEITVMVYRATSSTVGSVMLIDTTTNVAVCRPLSQQNTLTFFNVLDSQDNITIQNFPNGQCQPWVDNTMPSPAYDDLVRHLPYICGHACRNYETPALA